MHVRHLFLTGFTLFGMILSYILARSIFMKRKRAAITISLPPEMAEEYDKLAKRQAKNKSLLFREML